MPLIKIACLALAFLVAVLLADPTAAQTGGPDAQTAPAGEKERALATILDKALPTSRLPEIYADLRRTVRDIYLPALRDTLKGTAPDQPALTDAQKDTLQKVENLLDYSLRASDELEPFFAENRQDIILDVARLQAKYLTLEEIDAVGELPDMPAMRKIFNAVYAASRLFTGYSYEDVRSYYAQSAWLNELQLDLRSGQFAKPDAPPPSPEKIAKAQAIMNDLLRVSRLDEIVAELVRFAREAQSAAASSPKGDAGEEASQVEWLEFFYNMQKSMVLAVGPSTISSMLNDDQLDKLHLLILSPLLTKSFGMLYDAVRAITSLTRQDVQSLQAFSERAEKNGLFRERTAEEQAQLQLETQALAQIWRARARARLTPETRDGLDRAIMDIEAMQAKKFKIEDDGGAPGVRRL